jgi:hypothetical protein
LEQSGGTGKNSQERPVLYSQLEASHVKEDVCRLWGHRMPTWEEFKLASKDGRIFANKTLAMRAVWFRGVPRVYGLLFGFLTITAAYLAIPVLIALHFIIHLSAWWIASGIPIWWLLVKISEVGTCTGIIMGARENEALYALLVENGGFLFGPHGVNGLTWPTVAQVAERRM